MFGNHLLNGTTITFQNAIHIYNKERASRFLGGTDDSAMQYVEITFSWED